MASVLRNARILFQQHRLPTALRLVVTEAARKLLDPNKVSGYSQFGEDRLIEQYLDLNQSGFYVDVGCNHPVYRSNTYRLYQQGWRGLNIDANPQLVKLCERVRPRDINVCAAVSSRRERVTLSLAKDSCMSTLSADFATTMLGPGGVAERREVETSLLQDLLTAHNVPDRFDLLTIDVEGHDYEVLSSFDIRRFRPRLIMIEIHGLDLRNAASDRVVRYLAEHDYALVSYVCLTGFFVGA